MDEIAYQAPLSTGDCTPIEKDVIDIRPSSPFRKASLAAKQGQTDPARPDHAMESWIVDVNLLDECDGSSFQFRSQIMVIDPADGKGEAHLSMTLLNQGNGWVRKIEKAIPLSEIDRGRRRFRVSTKDLEMIGEGKCLSLRAHLPDVDIEMAGIARSPILMDNGKGEVQFLGVQQFKFSVPAINVNASICLMGQRREVSGLMLFDRQWGDVPPALQAKEGLDNLQSIRLYPRLDNGINLSAAQSWNFETDEVQQSCTMLLPDGTHIVSDIEPLQLSGYLSSPKAGKSYPRHIVLKDREQDICLQISLPCRQSEMICQVGSITQFGGKIIISGILKGEEVQGEGYAELVGRWD